MSFIKDFKAFIMRGNVVDLAVAVVIGAAFAAIIASLVENVITPLLLAPALKAAKLQDIDGARQQHEDTAWQGLVKVYEAMKPRDAAVIFNDLQMPVLLPVIDRMKESKAAPVLAAMNPDKARDVTAGLAQLRTHRDASGATAQKGG